MQRSATDHAAVSEVPPIVHEVLRSPGQPLDPGTRAFMEPRFGYDFSQVRVHADDKAAESAEAVNSQAYTVGRDVVFGANRYEPHPFEGGRLLAHELAHTIQQDKPSYVVPSSFALGQADGAYEREADAIGSSAMRTTAPPSATLTVNPLLQRQPTKTGTATTVEIKDNLPAIFFKFDSTEIRQDAKVDSMIHFVDALTQIQEHLKKYGAKAHITLHGFASAEGNPAHNLALSKRRAERIKKLLVEAGIPEAQITAIGHGVGNLFPVRELNRCVAIERTPEVKVK